MLGENGEPKNIHECWDSGCDAIQRSYEVSVVRHGTVTLRAKNEFDAIYQVNKCIHTNEICWDDDYAVTDAEIVGIPE